MNFIKSIITFLIFNRKITYETELSATKLLKGIEKHSKTQRNTRGQVSSHGFKMFYLSNLALLPIIEVPLIRIVGKVYNSNSKTQLDIRTKLSLLPKIMYALGMSFIIIFYILEKYFKFDFNEISDSIFPLFSIPFCYGFLLLIYFIETDSCKSNFQVIIRKIELEDKN